VTTGEAIAVEIFCDGGVCVCVCVCVCV
jgi:hypothetical protein